MLRIRKLVKEYRADGLCVEALRGVDIDLAFGEFVAVMGPSGSGKSTLLHVIGGLAAATSGEIWLRGQRVDALSKRDWAIQRRRHIGYVFQTANLLSTMTVADNVELPAILSGVSARQARQRREELLDDLGLTDKARVAPMVRELDRPQRRQQTAHLAGDRPGGRAEDRLGVALAPRHLVADRPRDVLGDPPARHRDGRQRRVQRPAPGDQLRPAGRDAGPVGGGAGHPPPGGPAVRDPVSGGRAHRPRHPEAGTGECVEEIGVPPVRPLQLGRLEHDRPGPPGGSLPAREPHRDDPGDAEGGQHLRGHRGGGAFRIEALRIGAF